MKNFRTQSPRILESIETFDLSADSRQQLLQRYFDFMGKQQKAGITLVSEVVRQVTLRQLAVATVARLEVVALYSNPLRAHPVSVSRKIYAVSRDKGLTWKFNVQDCTVDRLDDLVAGKQAVQTKAPTPGDGLGLD